MQRSGPRYDRATARLDPPFAIVDLAAFDANAAALTALASGKPIRLASKSVRCRELIARALAGPPSGRTSRTSQPTPWLPAGLTLTRAEGAGEVQPPVVGRVADGLRIGDRVWFRHAKAGELCEHVDALHLLSGDTSPAYPRPTAATERPSCS